MSRAGGYQPKTIAMFAALDKATDEWASLPDLAVMLCDQFGREYYHACRVVTEWASLRGGKVSKATAGRNTFYISKPNAIPNIEILAKRYWGQLPQGFKRDFEPGNLNDDIALQMVLLAYGYYVHERRDCRTAYNKLAQTHRMRKIQKEL